MAQPTSREGLIDYAKRQLGFPVLEINVADEQFQDLLDDAIQIYQERHYDGIARMYLKYKITYTLLKISFSLFIIKIILQTISAFPYFAHLATQQLDFVIGYIHLTFLGVVSISIVALLNEFKLITLSKTGFNIFFLGFITSEILIFYKGFATWLRWFFLENYFIYLIIVSALMPIGIFFLFINSEKKGTIK